MSHCKTKKQKLENSFSPIKTTHHHDDVSCTNQYKQTSYSPLSKKTGVTAVYAKIRLFGASPGLSKKVSSKSKYKKPKTSSKKVQKSKIITVLLDSGSDGDLLFHKKGTPKHFPYSTRQVPKSWCTSNGNFHTEGRGKLEMKFFEYSNSKQVYVNPDIVEYDGDNLKKPVFDLILGTQTMEELGIILDLKEQVITIDEIALPMRDITNQLLPRSGGLDFNNLASSLEPISTELATQRVVHILDANYQKADLPAVVKTCTHLSQNEQNELLELLNEFEDLFDGTLGDWNTEPVSFELKPDAKPYHSRAFPIPKVHKETILKEINRLVELGVLEWQPTSEWAAPSFIQPKKNGTVRFLTDFRRLNERLVRKPFPLPKISTVLQELEGFSYATALDLNMGYYTIRLDPDASKICTIIFPWGKYSYKRLPMGIAGSPDIFQAKMSELMATLEFVRTYLDDLLIITRLNLRDHLEKLKLALTRLRTANLKVNADKSTFCAHEIEYLGYILTREGIKPQPKKIAAILAISPPTNVKELRRFLGMVQYYRDMWTRRSEMLTPLTDLVGECGQTKVTKAKGTKKASWHWDETHQQAFDLVKTTISRDVILAYPDYSEKFEIYADASKSQIGSVITQLNKPLAFFSRKLSDTQKRYNVTEKELLAIVETLKEFKGMLWGQSIVVYTDHKNLTQDALGLTSDRVYRWRLLLEEYGPEIIYIKGIHNTVADAISRLEFIPQTLKEEQQNWMIRTKLWCRAKLAHKNREDEIFNYVFAHRNDDEEIFPLTVEEIVTAQLTDKAIQKNKSDYETKLVENNHVLCKDGRLVIPTKLQHRAIAWYHHYLQHPGHTRLEETLKQAMYWTGMRTSVRQYVKRCKSCQVNKRSKHSYGKLPPKQVLSIPWETLCVDLIGPYTIKGKDGTVLDFMCLTMIDPVSNWFEIVELPVVELPRTGTARKTQQRVGRTDNKTQEAIGQTKEAYFDKSSFMISKLVNKCWFSRYPRCKYVIYDNGSEFKLHFEDLCDSYGLKRKPTSIKNPQANAILERIHPVLMNMIRTSELDMADSVAPSDIDAILTDAAWAIRSTYHTVLKASPGAAIFGRDMLFDIPYLADWKKIGDYRQRQTDLNNLRENEKRIDYDYKVGDQILIRKDGILRKAESKWHDDPWTIVTIHTNGTIRVQRGNKSERLNIRRVKPYFENSTENLE